VRDPSFVARLRNVVSAVPAGPWKELQRSGLRTVIQRGGDNYDGFASLLSTEEVETPLRETLLWLAGQLHDDRAVDALAKALRSKDARVRSAAATALGFLGSERGLAPLQQAVVEDPDLETREAAAIALGTLDDPRGVPTLIGVLSNGSEDSSVRGTAAEKLGWLQDRRALQPLVKALGDPAPEVRFWAAHALGWLGDEATVPALSKLETDSVEIDTHGTIAAEAEEAIRNIRSRRDQ
jgi:HEAT repeat protein